MLRHIVKQNYTPPGLFHRQILRHGRSFHILKYMKRQNTSQHTRPGIKTFTNSSENNEKNDKFITELKEMNSTLSGISISLIIISGVLIFIGVRG